MEDRSKEVLCKQGVLLTGGSGFLGRYLAAEFLQQGKTVFFLLRSHQNQSSQTRILKILNTIRVSPILFPHVFVIEGDITKPLCDIPNEWIKKNNAIIGSIIHAAGIVKFRGKTTLTQSNIEGTKNVIELAHRLRVSLHYISTAYVSGDSHNHKIAEDALLIKTRFRNEYEKSKYEAELLVRKATSSGYITSTIYRPSILIGHSKTGEAFTFSGYYVPLFYFCRLQNSWLLKKWKKTIKFPVFYVKDASINFIQVDYAAHFIAKISQDIRSKNRTFHIVHPYPVNARFMLQITLEFLHYPPIFFFALPKICVQILRKILHGIGYIFGKQGKKFQTQLGDYIEYLTDNHEFSLDNTRKLLGEEVNHVPRITKEFVVKCARYALKVKGMIAP